MRINLLSAYLALCYVMSSYIIISYHMLCYQLLAPVIHPFTHVQSCLSCHTLIQSRVIANIYTWNHHPEPCHHIDWSATRVISLVLFQSNHLISDSYTTSYHLVIVTPLSPNAAPFDLLCCIMIWFHWSSSCPHSHCLILFISFWISSLLPLLYHIISYLHSSDRPHYH